MKKQSGYFEWLLKKIGADEEYRCLAEWLMNIDFYSRLEGDMNRAQEGLQLRRGSYDAPPGPCTVLEMMVALCREMEYETDGLLASGSPSDAGYWFREMISNLGIGGLDDHFWVKNPRAAEEIAHHSVEIWLDREYDFDGNGGIFPLKNARNDQTETEIWYQMNAYLMEKMDEK